MKKIYTICLVLALLVMTSVCVYAEAYTGTVSELKENPYELPFEYHDGMKYDVSFDVSFEGIQTRVAVYVSELHGSAGQGYVALMAVEDGNYHVDYTTRRSDVSALRLTFSGVENEDVVVTLDNVIVSEHVIEETETTGAETEMETDAVGAETSEETTAESEKEPTSESEKETDAVVTPAPDPGETEGEMLANFFTRLYQWFVDNKLMIVSVVLDGIIIGILYLVKRTKSKMDDKIVSQLVDIKSDASAASTNTSATDTNVTAAVNGLIDGYNDMNASYKAQQHLEDERNKVVSSVLETNLAILGILQTVYANNRNIPQGTKDLINYKYAKCLTTLENDEELKAIAELVKKSVEGESNDEQEKGKTD